MSKSHRQSRDSGELARGPVQDVAGFSWTGTRPNVVSVERIIGPLRRVTFGPIGLRRGPCYPLVMIWHQFMSVAAVALFAAFIVFITFGERTRQRF